MADTDREVRQILSFITTLVAPNLANGKSVNLKEALKSNIDKSSQLDSCKIQELKHLSGIGYSKRTDDISWTYVCISLEALLKLKECLLRDKDELLSIAQQKSVRSCFEFVITLGLLPNLLPGVGLSLQHRSSHAQKLLAESVTEIDGTTNEEKYERICAVTRSLWTLLEEETLNGLILPRYMGDLLAVLCQLVFAPYKQPSPELLDDVDGFKRYLAHVISATHKPIIISELMLLQGNQKCPNWLKRGLSKLLTSKLMEKDGVLATVQAIQYNANKNSPVLTTGLESVARLITTPHINDATKYYNIVLPQIIALIRSEDIAVLQVGVLCCRVLYERDKTICKEYILTEIMDPLTSPSISLSEEEITQCLIDLYRCFAVPSSDMWAVPIEPLLPICCIIHHLYCTIFDRALTIKGYVDDLLWAMLSRSNKEQLNKLLPSILFLENNSEDFYSVPDNVHFVYGEDGGVKFSNGKTKINKAFDRSIFKLIREKDKGGSVSKSVFIFLLNSVTNLEKGLSEKRLFVTEILAELAESSVVQKNIIKDPMPIVDFITSLINTKLDTCDDEVEMICLALMLLSIILNDMFRSKKANWSVFGKLMVSLPLLSKNTGNLEIKTLCDEVYNTILTEGFETKPRGQSKFSHSLSSKSECAKALEDACDALLPVRGHALIVLSKLIVAGDSEAKAKKDTILCIFQENLKHEDSYLYLTAIEGLASLAAECPDTVLLTLAEEYIRSESDVRLKVGESLMRVIRLLGEMVPVYKTELLNALLTGVRDPDNLVRASSLSNVGELCKLLSYRIGSIASEILNCVECVVSTDRAPEPRRAAVLLLTLLLRGLEKDALTVLEPILLQLYRTLRKIYKTDKDEVTRLHAQLAIEEIDSMALSFFFPAENLSKRIYVLDPAP